MVPISPATLISSSPPASEPSQITGATPWHALGAEQVLEAVDSGRRGLSEAEALRRSNRYGPNLFRPAPPISPWSVLLDQLRSVLVVLLVLAAAVSAVSGDRADVVAIATVLVINVAIGFSTDLRARRAMEALVRLEVLRARVVREGRSRTVDARELVPGDILLLEAGQVVPADARLVESAELRAVEASLSGEPAPVAKEAGAVVPADAPLADRVSMLYKTTSIVAGTARAVVVATGMRTEVGRIGELAGRVPKGRTPLERRLDALGRRLAMVAVAVAAVMVVIGAVQDVPASRLLQMAIALAVAAVPEGLPVVATIALAVGVRRMARRRALIRHLPVVETLGSASVICSDKTGTLTTSEMRVTVLRLAEREVTVGGEEGRPVRIGNAAGELSSDPVLGRALEIGVLANAAELPRPDAPGHPVGDPTDVAFLVLGRSAGLERAHLLAAWPEVRHVPFSSERMLMASTHSRGEGLTTFVKGSPQAVLERCDRVLTDKGIAELRPEQREELLASNRELAGRGLRVLGLATKEALRGRGDDLSGLTWVALAGLSDPPAAGVIDTVRGFRDAGIRTVMITGDHRLTAASVGRDLGLLGPDDDILEGRDLDRLSDTELDGIITRVGVFGRVSPESKLRIVAAFQRRGEIVAMLGDGVNDAAALRKADIGVAMGRRGTDLAKEAADVILEDDRFATIGVAIEEGRVIRENIRKFVAYLFSCNLAEILVLLGAGLAGYPGILTPLQILWLNLLTDTFPALALAVEPGEPGIMRKPPPGLRVDILPGTELWSATAYALLIATGTLVAFAWGQRRGDPAAATTLAFMTLALAQVLHLGNARSRGPVLSRRRVLENLAALGAAVLAIALQVLVALSPLFSRVLDVTPLSLPDWLAVLLLAALPAVAGQTVKWLRASRR